MSRGLAASLTLVLLAGVVWVSGVSSCLRPSQAGPGPATSDRRDAPNRAGDHRSSSTPRPVSPSQQKDGQIPISEDGSGEPTSPEWTLDEVLAAARKLRKRDIMAMFSPHGGGDEADVESTADRFAWWVEEHKGKLTDAEMERIALSYRAADLTEISALNYLLGSTIPVRDQAEWTRRGGKGRLDRQGWSRVSLSPAAQEALMKALREWGVWTRSEYDWEGREYFDHWEDFMRGMQKELVAELLARSGYAPVGVWLTDHPERMRKWNLGGALVGPALIHSSRYETDAERRSMARKVLANMRDPEAAPLLLPLLRDEDHELRLSALKGLSREQYPVQTADLILFLQEAMTDVERAEAIKTLGESGNTAIGSMFLDLAKDRTMRLREKSPRARLRDDPVLWESCEALARLRDPAAIDWWLGAILRPNDISDNSGLCGLDRLKLIEWLGRSKAEKAKPMLDAILRDSTQSEGTRLAARSALQMVTGDMKYGFDVKIEGNKK